MTNCSAAEEGRGSCPAATLVTGRTRPPPAAHAPKGNKLPPPHGDDALEARRHLPHRPDLGQRPLMPFIPAPPELQARLEKRRPRAKWGSVRGIAEANDALCKLLPELPQTKLLAVDAPIGGGAAVAAAAGPASWSAGPAEAASPAVAGAGHTALESTATELCIANVDTLSAALELGDACALNFANADTPGGRYRSGGRAQEEDLCRCLPQLYHALSTSGCYPIAPGTALLTRGLQAVRRPGSYEVCEGGGSMGEVTVVTAAMPCGKADRRPRGGWAGSAWGEDVTLRIRAVLHAARYSGHPNVVLGAFGCGAFGNPAPATAAIFREVLASPEFDGAFSRVVFAVLDPLGTGNIGPFRKELGRLLTVKRQAGQAQQQAPSHARSTRTEEAATADGATGDELAKGGDVSTRHMVDQQPTS
jgi:hypothetical protein